jgi:hypothetical protein
MESKRLHGLSGAVVFLLATLWWEFPASSNLLQAMTRDKGTWEVMGLTSSQGQVFRAQKVHSFKGLSLFCDGCKRDKRVSNAQKN